MYVVLTVGVLDAEEEEEEEEEPLLKEELCCLVEALLLLGTALISSVSKPIPCPAL